MKRLALSLLSLFLLMGGSPAGLAQDEAFPQVKIDHIQWLNGSRVRMFVTFLDGGRRPVSVDRLSELTVSRRQGKSRAEPIAVFEYGQPGPLDDTATLHPRVKSGAGTDVVVIAPGTLASPFANPVADRHLRKGIESLFRNLAKEDRGNLIWVGDHLHTFIPSKGKTADFSNLDDRYDDCIAAQEHAGKTSLPDAGIQVGLELNDLHDEACGVVSNSGEISRIIGNAQGYGGYYPNLFGVRLPLPNVTPEHPRQELLGTRKQTPSPAVGEAFKMLLRSREEHRAPPVLVLISDGMDGYIHAEDDALLRFREKDCPGELGADAKDSAIERCAQGKLDQFRAAEQDRFRDRASQWLALSHASDTRIHGVGFKSNPIQPDFLTDRIQVLSLESGGTYRLAREGNELFEQLNALSAEIAGQYVIEFDSGMRSGETAELLVAVQVDQGNAFESRSFPLERKLPPNQWIPELVGDRLAWVQAKLGFYWYRALYVALSILLGLLLLWGIYKFVKGIRGKLKKAMEKEKKAVQKKVQASGTQMGRRR